MTELGERLKKLITSQGFNNRTFAKKVGVAPNYISILFKKDSLPNSFSFKVTKAIPDVNLDWLENGKGKMLKGDDSLIDLNFEELSKRKIPLVKEHLSYIEDAILFSEEELLNESEVIRDWVETIKLKTRIETIKKLKDLGKLT